MDLSAKVRSTEEYSNNMHAMKPKINEKTKKVNKKERKSNCKFLYLKSNWWRKATSMHSIRAHDMWDERRKLVNLVFYILRFSLGKKMTTDELLNHFKLHRRRCRITKKREKINKNAINKNNEQQKFAFKNINLIKSFKFRDQ